MASLPIVYRPGLPPSIKRIVDRAGAFSNGFYKICAQLPEELTHDLRCRLIQIKENSPVYFYIERNPNKWFIVTDTRVPIHLRCIQGRKLEGKDPVFPSLKFKKKKRTYAEHIVASAEFEEEWVRKYTELKTEGRCYEELLHKVHDIQIVTVTTLEALVAEMRTEINRIIFSAKKAANGNALRKYHDEIRQIETPLGVILSEIRSRKAPQLFLPAPTKLAGIKDDGSNGS